jgi:hypothetical protein
MGLQEVVGSMEWIDLAQDTERWWKLINAVKNFGFHKMRGIVLVAENWLGSQEGLYSME